MYFVLYIRCGYIIGLNSKGVGGEQNIIDLSCSTVSEALT
jgi:hypothetical protein